MFNEISEYLETAVSSRIFPGCSVGIVSPFGTWCTGVGKLTYENESQNVTERTVYDVASVTKAIPVSLLALKLLESGELSIDGLLCSIVPEYSGNYRDRVTIRHLLTHTLAFGFRMSSLSAQAPDDLLHSILSAPLSEPPGMVFSYANATSILLGIVVERIMNDPIDKAAERLLFGPLSMTSTTFHPENGGVGSIAPTEYDEFKNGCIVGVVHDESARGFHPRVVGSAGLFSSTIDLLKCLRMLIDEGTAGGVQFFKNETVRQMATNVLPESMGSKASLGWELDQPFMGLKRGKNTFGKTGFTGCSVVIDPDRQTGVVLLSNHVHPRRFQDRSVINSVRADVADLVYAAIDTAS